MITDPLSVTIKGILFSFPTLSSRKQNLYLLIEVCQTVAKSFVTLSELLGKIIQTNSEMHGKSFKNAKFYWKNATQQI